MPTGLRSWVPAKITSCMCAPRKVLALCSPSTQLTPSRMFDLPHPFGPTTAAIPVPVTVNSVRSQKLLKPRMWIFFNFSIIAPDSLGFALGLFKRATGRLRSCAASRNCPTITDSTKLGGHGQPLGVRFLWIRGAGIRLFRETSECSVELELFKKFRPVFAQVEIVCCSCLLF